MQKDFSTLEPGKPIDRVYAEEKPRDGNYIVPTNHYHPYYELYYLKTGRCRFFIGGRMLDLRDGDLLMIPPRTMHYTRYLYGACKREALFFRKRDLETEVMNTYPGQELFFTRWRLIQIPDFYRETVDSIFERMNQEEIINDLRTPMLQKCRLHEMLLLCGRSGLFPEDPPPDIHTTEQAIVRAAEVMRKRFREPLTSNEIASEAGFSPNYLSRKFREAAGMGVHEYLTFLRLHQAALELAETKDSITAIALRCGFSDGNYFKDCFKKHYGVSPREYRAGRE